MKLVIFDVDGTLVDSQHHIFEAQTRAFTRLGLTPPSRNRALSVVGLSLHEAFLELVGGDGPVQRLTEAYKDAWTLMRGETGFAETLYPGAAGLVDELRGQAGLVLGLATGKSRPGVDRLIKAQGWASVFETIQTADGHPSKPHPSMILAAMRETGCDRAGTMMIGDTTFDIDMAVAGGIRAVGVAWGYHEPDALRRAGAACIVTGFDALRSEIDSFKRED